tara:strand:- start:1554 stop:1877 length:324 start_codon:yes stop_codon:yes gene_type:complete
MTMDDTEKFEEELTTFIHDLFLNTEYLNWRKNLKSYSANSWHSLIVKFDELGLPLTRLKSFGEPTFSKLVFSYIKAPDYKSSQMLMVQFTVSGSMWHSLVWHCPERS